jgi:protein-L-isoaspartate(D-aspartate) O-methyltransferase
VPSWEKVVPLSQADLVNQQMVDRLIAEGALWSPALITAFRATPRHRFLDRVFQFQRKQNRWREVATTDPGAAELRILYSDRALITRLSAPTVSGPGPVVPISSSSQPSLMAQMLEDLKLSAGLSVLEVGAGTGYNAALMSHVVGPGQVTAVDVDSQVLAEARHHLQAFDDRDVRLEHADGRAGFADEAPYDRIIVTAATPDLEPAWLEQLAQQGLLLAPLALAPGLAYIVRGTVTEGVFHGRLTRAAYFMPLRAEGEAGTSELEGLAPGGPLRTLPAPWAGWFDRRRPRVNWLGFSQSLAFYGLLRGLTVHYRSLTNQQPAFGVSDQATVCWFGDQEWEVSGESGRDLGWVLWRAFLDAGGPWPTEFRVKACPTAPPVMSSRRETYVRPGPRCWHVWELLEPRDRGAWI